MSRIVKPPTVAPAVAGFWGKLPARGDFVRAGLPRGFTDPWDGWLAAGIQTSREMLADTWVDAWLEAPIWRFALPRNICGEQAVIGLFVPSVDAAGRYYPLTLAALLPGAAIAPDPAAAANWLDHAEAAALAALADDLTPDALLARLATKPLPQAATTDLTLRFWTEGAPRVAATQLEFTALPNPTRFRAMIDDTTSESTA